MRRILLVEDDPDLYLLLEHVLVGDGYAVDVAATTASARAFLNTSAYDMVLADSSLPDGDGIDIADEAKRRGMKTLVLTGYGLRTSADRLAQHEYLLKPVGMPELLGVISRRIGPTAMGGAGAPP
jgi:two-component system response regulator PilR (NtrC family)